MGYYIEVPENHNKAQQLVGIYGAQIIPRPSKFTDIPEDKALICVVSNLNFDAAGYCFNEHEFEAFKKDVHVFQRPRTWVLMDKAKAIKLSGFGEGRAGWLP